VVNLPPEAGLQLELPRHIRARLAGLDRLSTSETLRTRIRQAIAAAL
jgi:hypothetical protein